MSEYLNELNDAQRNAVEHIEGPALIIAGAGSGKTRVLTYRIVHLLNLGIPAHSIMALTFTNKAAAEMKNRIEKMAENHAAGLWMGTFHSIFAKILRNEAETIDYPTNFTIYDTTDAKNLVKTILKELNLEENTYKPNDIYHRISWAKNNLISAERYLKNTEIQKRDVLYKIPEMGKIYQIYTQRCKIAAAMDFDDLLYKTNVLFLNSPEILKKYQQRFQYVLVDEFQDTNLSQYKIIRFLTETHKNLCVVGDDAQSIYSFRGATIENILNFRKDFPESKLYKLEQNYRSTQTIVSAANCVIEKNSHQIKKNIYSQNEIGRKIKLLQSISDLEEGVNIARLIDFSVKTYKTQYSQHCILYRTNAQSRIFEETLRKFNIPCKVYGNLSFYDRKEIKDVLAYFRLIINHLDEEALKRIINYPKRGIGDSTIEKLQFLSVARGTNIWNILLEAHKINDLTAGIKEKLQNFVKMILVFSEKLNIIDAYSLSKEILRISGIIADLESDKSPEGMSRLENIAELVNGIRIFVEQKDNEKAKELPTLEKYLNEVSLLTDFELDKPEDKNKVFLMTIHSAKGLGFQNVYIAGAEENLFPNSLSTSDLESLEEERRLFYVALTRAEKFAVISFAKQRYRWGQTISNSPSRFILDINPQFLDVQNTTFDNFSQKNVVSKSNFWKPKENFVPVKNEEYIEETQTEISNYRVGMKVKHEKFGNGKIIMLQGNAQDIKATVSFDNFGTKILLLKYAKLEIL